MKKTFKLFRIIALACALFIVLTACGGAGVGDDGVGNGGGSSSPVITTYESTTAGGDTVILTMTETGRAALAKDNSYKLEIKRGGTTKTSTGKIAGVEDDVLELLPDGANVSFGMVVSSDKITGLFGKVTFTDDLNNTESFSMDLIPKGSSPIPKKLTVTDIDISKFSDGLRVTIDVFIGSEIDEDGCLVRSFRIIATDSTTDVDEDVTFELRNNAPPPYDVEWIGTGRYLVTLWNNAEPLFVKEGVSYEIYQSEQKINFTSEITTVSFETDFWNDVWYDD